MFYPDYECLYALQPFGINNPPGDFGLDRVQTVCQSLAGAVGGCQAVEVASAAAPPGREMGLLGD
jgi:hypothetical protein